MNVKLTIALALGLALAGCYAAPQYNYSPIVTAISKPMINEVVTAYVGDELLVEGTSAKQDAIFVKQQISMGLGAYVITPGYFAKTGDDANYYYYSIGGVKSAGQVQRSSNFVDAAKSVSISKDGGRLCVINSLNTPNCIGINTNSILQTSVDLPTQESSKKVLIYKGKKDGKLVIGYREFSSIVDKDLISNEVEYDLSESNKVNYKGAVLEIIEANSQSIKYKVLNGFKKTEL